MTRRGAARAVGTSLRPGLLALGLAGLGLAGLATGTVTGLATGTAAAQGVGETRNPGSPLPGGGTTRDLTVPGNGGVAGTGLGGATGGTGNGAASGAVGGPGTGGSVKGPAGQGIDGQGRSNGIGAGPNP